MHRPTRSPSWGLHALHNCVSRCLSDMIHILNPLLTLLATLAGPHNSPACVCSCTSLPQVLCTCCSHSLELLLLGSPKLDPQFTHFPAQRHLSSRELYLKCHSHHLILLYFLSYHLWWPSIRWENWNFKLSLFLCFFPRTILPKVRIIQCTNNGNTHVQKLTVIWTRVLLHPFVAPCGLLW